MSNMAPKKRKAPGDKSASGSTGSKAATAERKSKGARVGDSLHCAVCDASTDEVAWGASQ